MKKKTLISLIFLALFLLLVIAAQISAATDEGTVNHTELAMEYILGSENVYSAQWGVYKEDTLRALLDAGTPVIVARGWYIESERIGGHSTVIYDYYWDDELSVYMYEIFDPSPVNAGRPYARSYASICNGNNAIPNSDDVTDTGIWESSVVFEVGSYSSTISYLNKF